MAERRIKSILSIAHDLNSEVSNKMALVVNRPVENQIDSSTMEELPVESEGAVNPAALILLGFVAVAGLWSFSLLLEYLMPD